MQLQITRNAVKKKKEKIYTTNTSKINKCLDQISTALSNKNPFYCNSHPVIAYNHLLKPFTSNPTYKIIQNQPWI